MPTVPPGTGQRRGAPAPAHRSGTSFRRAAPARSSGTPSGAPAREVHVKVLVTGATGNVGSAVVRRLRSEPWVDEVVGLSRRGGGDADRTVRADLGRPSSEPVLRDALREVDAVVHLAWLIQPSHDEPALRATNVGGARRVLDAARETQVGHVVVVSSVGAYSRGPKDRPVDESWPTDGVPSSSYSRYKAEVERLMDSAERGLPLLTRLRPGLVFQRGASTEITRYFLGRFVPRSLLGRLKVPALPLPPQLVFQAVHADDVAAAVATVLERRAGGAFNVAAEPPLTPDDLARAVGAQRSVPLPIGVLRPLVSLTWRAHLQPTDGGWIDLAASVPLMTTDRLRALGWAPQHDAVSALHELVTGMRDGVGELTPPLRPGTRRPEA
jgi:nucleoside-diphosphate-sugar epimerase